jgi:hypothetical protein
MRKLGFLVLALVMLLAIDELAKAFSSRTIASAVERKVHGVSSVDADIDSFPFLGRLLVQGSVSELDVTFRNVTGHGIDVAHLRFEAKGLELDRGVLFSRRNVRVRDVDRVTAEATITEEQIREVTGADVRLADGRATVSAGGATATATIKVIEGRVRMEVGSLPAVSIPIPDADLLPCAVEAEVVEDALVLSCTAEELPGIVVDAIGHVDLQR